MQNSFSEEIEGTSAPAVTRPLIWNLVKSWRYNASLFLAGKFYCPYTYLPEALLTIFIVWINN